MSIGRRRAPTLPDPSTLSLEEQEALQREDWSSEEEIFVEISPCNVSLPGPAERPAIEAFSRAARQIGVDTSGELSDSEEAAVPEAPAVDLALKQEEHRLRTFFRESVVSLSSLTADTPLVGPPSEAELVAGVFTSAEGVMIGMHRRWSPIVARSLSGLLSLLKHKDMVRTLLFLDRWGASVKVGILEESASLTFTFTSRGPGETLRMVSKPDILSYVSYSDARRIAMLDESDGALGPGQLEEGATTANPGFFPRAHNSARDYVERHSLVEPNQSIIDMSNCWVPDLGVYYSVEREMIPVDFEAKATAARRERDKEVNPDAAATEAFAAVCAILVLASKTGKDEVTGHYHASSEMVSDTALRFDSAAADAFERQAISSDEWNIPWCRLGTDMLLRSRSPTTVLFSFVEDLPLAAAVPGCEKYGMSYGSARTRVRQLSGRETSRPKPETDFERSLQASGVFSSEDTLPPCLLPPAGRAVSKYLQAQIYKGAGPRVLIHVPDRLTETERSSLAGSLVTAGAIQGMDMPHFFSSLGMTIFDGVSVSYCDVNHRATSGRINFNLPETDLMRQRESLQEADLSRYLGSAGADERESEECAEAFRSLIEVVAPARMGTYGKHDRTAASRLSGFFTGPWPREVLSSKGRSFTLRTKTDAGMFMRCVAMGGLMHEMPGSQSMFPLSAQASFMLGLPSRVTVGAPISMREFYRFSSRSPFVLTAKRSVKGGADITPTSELEGGTFSEASAIRFKLITSLDELPFDVRTCRGVEDLSSFDWRMDIEVDDDLTWICSTPELFIGVYPGELSAPGFVESAGLSTKFLSVLDGVRARWMSGRRELLYKRETEMGAFGPGGSFSVAVMFEVATKGLSKKLRDHTLNPEAHSCLPTSIHDMVLGPCTPERDNPGTDLDAVLGRMIGFVPEWLRGQEAERLYGRTLTSGQAAETMKEECKAASRFFSGSSSERVASNLSALSTSWSLNSADVKLVLGINSVSANVLTEHQPMLPHGRAATVASLALSNLPLPDYLSTPSLRLLYCKVVTTKGSGIRDTARSISLYNSVGVYANSVDSVRQVVSEAPFCKEEMEAVTSSPKHWVDLETALRKSWLKAKSEVSPGRSSMMDKGVTRAENPINEMFAQVCEHNEVSTLRGACSLLRTVIEGLQDWLEPSLSPVRCMEMLLATPFKYESGAPTEGFSLAKRLEETAAAFTTLFPEKGA